MSLSVVELREDLFSSRSLLGMLLIELSCVRGLMHHVCRWTRLCPILMCCACNLLPRPRYITIYLHAGVLRFRYRWWPPIRLTLIGAFHRRVGVNDILRMAIYRRDERSLTRLCSGCSVPCFGSSGALVASHIFFGEPLFDCFCFPVIVSDPPSSFNDSGTELAKHGLGGDDCNLPGPIRIWEDFLMYQFVLLLLCSDDLMQRPILVEEKVRVSVT